MKPEVQMGKGTVISMSPAIYLKTFPMQCPNVTNLRQPLNSLKKIWAILSTTGNCLPPPCATVPMSMRFKNADFSDNQRLEFLGDAVLGLVIGELLMEHSPDMNEGDLSKMRAGLVSEPGLAAMARKIDLGRFIYLGKGEWLSGGSEKNSILSDTFEAVMAAIYLDLGFTQTARLIKNLFREQMTLITSSTTMVDDYKSLLQEYVQEMGEKAPQYTVSGEWGPDHAKIFEVELKVCHIQTTGIGKSKKTAEQDAAENALKRLEKEKPLKREKMKIQQGLENRKDSETAENPNSRGNQDPQE